MERPLSAPESGRPAARGAWAVAGLLAAAAAAGWTALLVLGDELPMGVVFWLLAWLAMMTAMMLPSASPLVLIYRRLAGRTGDSMLLAAGYLVVWTAVGVAAYALDRLLPDPGAAAVAAVLLVAGIYQLTPLKHACLRRCRTPLDFLVTRWRRGRLGALQLGVEHGAYCVGCCWALMAVLIVAASMALVWVGVIAVAVAAEKLLPRGPLLGKLGGIALVALGIAMIV
jgi:predicted metal-binding membrane protein